MKKYFVAAVLLLAVVAIAMPASAKVEFSYGGLFRARLISQDNFADPAATTTPTGGDRSPLTDYSEETLNRIDQRIRLYFTATASENLKLVTKFEANEIWGNSNSSGRVGADHPNDFVVKNAYLDFNIPNGFAKINAKVGIQTINLMNSWMIDDDFSSANVSVKLDPFKVTLAYIAGRNDDLYNEKDNIDDLFLAIDYVCGPWSAQVIALAQFGNDNNVSADPATLITPVGATNDLAGTTLNTAAGWNFPNSGHAMMSAINLNPYTNASQGHPNFFRRYLANRFPYGQIVNNPNSAWAFFSDNNLFNLGFDLRYKVDFMSAYLTFIKNFGSVNVVLSDTNTPGGTGQTAIVRNRNVNMDYTGWMLDAGGSYFCGPFTFNFGGFYTSGPENIQESLSPNFAGDGIVRFKKTGDIDWFTYPLATSKYFSEIIGGGILDNMAPGHEDQQWRGYGFPSNLWTINAGAAWQALPSTKVSFSYWYFGTSEDVVSGPTSRTLRGLGGHQGFLNAYFNNLLTYHDVDFASDIGHELNLNIEHKIVDGLTLDLVGAYLFTGDAYSMRADDNDAMELGARLQWSF